MLMLCTPSIGAVVAADVAALAELCDTLRLPPLTELECRVTDVPGELVIEIVNAPDARGDDAARQFNYALWERVNEHPEIELADVERARRS